MCHAQLFQFHLFLAGNCAHTMKVAVLQLLLLHLFGCVMAWKLQSCNNTVSISCSSGVIAIKSAPASIAQRLRELCNARQKCSVSNPSGGCVYIIYLCWRDGPTLEIKESTAVGINLTSSVMYISSEGYLDGRYTSVYTIKCGLTLSQASLKHMKFWAFELTHIGNSTGFCLSVGNSITPLTCSDSRKFSLQYLGPLYETSGRFSLTLRAKTPRATQARFWLRLEGYDGMKNVVCQSEPVMSPSTIGEPVPTTTELMPDDMTETTASENKGLSTSAATTEVIVDDMTETTVPKKKGLAQTAIIIIVLSVVCGFFCLTTAGLVFKKAFRCRQSNRRPNAAGTENEHEYDYIDLRLMNPRVNIEREDNTAQGIEVRNDDPIPRTTKEPETYLEPISRRNIQVPDEKYSYSVQKPEDYLEPVSSCKTHASDDESSYDDAYSARKFVQASGNVASKKNTYIPMENPKKKNQSGYRLQEEPYVSMNNPEYENQFGNRMQAEKEENVKPEDVPHDYLELH